MKGVSFVFAAIRSGGGRHCRAAFLHDISAFGEGGPLSERKERFPDGRCLNPGIRLLAWQLL